MMPGALFLVHHATQKAPPSEPHSFLAQCVTCEKPAGCLHFWELLGGARGRASILSLCVCSGSRREDRKGNREAVRYSGRVPSVVRSQQGCGEMTDWDTGKNDTAPGRELLTPREIVVGR